MASSTFQPHINGMRALAILGVVFYHLNSRYCPAGYFGVDIFLVISGYFLFGKLLQTEDALQFRYVDYLAGKAKRLLPPLWAVLAAVYAVIVFFLTGQPGADGLATCGYFGAEIALLVMAAMVVRAFLRWRGISLRHGGWLAMAAAAAAIVLLSCPGKLSIILRAGSVLGFDYRLDGKGNYFSPLTHENPLLHLWYMGITCQLYILAPLLVVPFIRNGRKRWSKAVLCAVFALSLSLWVATTSRSFLPPETRRVMCEGLQTHNSYYHLLPRMWEIIAGCAVLLLPAGKGGGWQGPAALVALAGCILCFFLFPTGSACSYPVVLLTLLLIKYGSAGWCGRALAWKPVQFIGSISFSLYLWHWPVMAVYKYVAGRDIGPWDDAAMVALSFLPAYLAWRFVEKAGGKRTAPDTRRGWIAKFAGICLLAGACCFAGVTRSRVKEADKAMLARAYGEAGLTAPVNAAIPMKAEDLPAGRIVQDFPANGFLNPAVYLGEDEGLEPSFFLMGDSHAGHLVAGLHATAAKYGLRGVALNNSVSPVWNYESTGTQNSNAQWSEGIADSILEYLAAHPSIEYVFISMSWVRATAVTDAQDWEGRAWPEGRYQELYMAGIEETCRRITAMGKKVILLAHTPRFAEPGPSVVWDRRYKLTRQGAPVCYIGREAHYAYAGPINNLLTPIVQRRAAYAIIDPSPAVLDLTPQGCPTIYNGVFTFYDSHHFTPESSAWVADYILRQLRQQETGSQGGE